MQFRKQKENDQFKIELASDKNCRVFVEIQISNKTF